MSAEITGHGGKCYLPRRRWEPSGGSSDGEPLKSRYFKVGQAAGGGGGSSRRDAQGVPGEQAWKGLLREGGLDRKEPGREREELENEKERCCGG